MMPRTEFFFSVLFLTLWIGGINGSVYGPFTVQLEPRAHLTWSILSDIITLRYSVANPGWIAFGLSESGIMIPSDAYIGYVLSGTAVADDYFLTTRQVLCPGVCPDKNQGGKDDILSFTVEYVGGITTFTFSRHLNTGDSKDVPIVEGLMDIVYSFSSNGDTNLQYHSSKNRGTGQINFFTGDSVIGDNSLTRQLLIAHGVIMFSMWNVVTSLSVLYVRYFVPRGKGVRIHKYTQQIVMLTAIPSFIIALYAVKSHYRTTHGIIGTIFLCGTSIQGFLGNLMVFSIPLWNLKIEQRIFRGFKFRFSIPVRRIGHLIHPYLGKILFGLSFAQVYLGMNQLPAGPIFETFYWVWVALVATFVFFKEIQRFYHKYKEKAQIHSLENPGEEPPPFNKPWLLTEEQIRKANSKSMFNSSNSQLAVFSAVVLFALTTGIWAIIFGTWITVGSSGSIDTGNLREYYVAAEEIQWNYVPLGYNVLANRTFEGEELLFVAKTSNSLGSVWKKAIYREYTDSTFSTPKTLAPEWEHLGLYSVVLRAEVGDTIVVHFLNKASRNYTMHPHGVFYAKSDEGFHYNDGTIGPKLSDSVPPGGSYTYVWPVPERSGPSNTDPSSVFWAFHSHVDEPKDIASGLVGGIIVTGKGLTTSDTEFRPKDIDREFVIFISVIDESTSQYFQQNIEANALNVSTLQTSSIYFIFSNYKAAINGLMFSNLQGLVMNKNERVRWYISSFGSSSDPHTAHWHGQTTSSSGHKIVALNLFSASMYSVDMLAANVGEYVFHCHFTSHDGAGMNAIFTVLDSTIPDPYTPDGIVRTYYIAAEQVIWDYVPQGYNVIQNRTWNQAESGYTVNTPTNIGGKYFKAKYVQYTDDTFTTPSPIPPQWQHLGIMGPVIRATVGDTVIVHFLNRISIPVNLVPDSIPFNDSSPVLPGESKTYLWEISSNVGPTPTDPSTTFWLYHSSVIESLDIFAGLTGVIIVNRANTTGDLPGDVDREFVVQYSAIDENQSPFYSENVETFANQSAPGSLPGNIKYNINGYLYGNGPLMTMNRNERVRWYVFTVGDYTDVHSPYWQGQSLLFQSRRTSSADLLPARMEILDMIADRPGTFVLECMITDHVPKGAQALFYVNSTSSYQVPSNSTVWTYYIAAEEIVWNYAPKGYNRLFNTSWSTPNELSAAAGGINPLTGPTIGSQYTKAVYVEYTDGTFTQKKPIDPEWSHKGILGPVIRGEVGDTILIHFLNRASFPCNIIPHGLIRISGSTTGVPTGETTDEVWYISETSAPESDGISSIMWVYRSDADEVANVNSGLLGTILVTASGQSGSGTLRPADVDREFIVAFQNFDETQSYYYNQNLETYLGNISSISYLQDPNFVTSNIKATVNGYIYANGEGFVMVKGEAVRWYVLNIGSSIDLHSAHWHAVTLIYNGKRLDVLTLHPTSMASLDMITDNPGTWIFHCHASDHLANGMSSLYTILPG